MSFDIMKFPWHDSALVEIEIVDRDLYAKLELESETNTPVLNQQVLIFKDCEVDQQEVYKIRKAIVEGESIEILRFEIISNETPFIVLLHLTSHNFHTHANTYFQIRMGFEGVEAPPSLPI